MEKNDKEIIWKLFTSTKCDEIGVGLLLIPVKKLCLEIFLRLAYTCQWEHDTLHVEKTLNPKPKKLTSPLCIPGKVWWILWKTGSSIGAMKGNFGNSNFLSLDCGHHRSCQLFLADIYNQAIRGKLTFFKLQGRQEAALSLEKATKILSLKEATKCELHEKKNTAWHGSQSLRMVTIQRSQRRPLKASHWICAYYNH